MSDQRHEWQADRTTVHVSRTTTGRFAYVNWNRADTIGPRGVTKDIMAIEILRLAAALAHANAERERLSGWLEKIEGGDRPCLDESQLRQWAYEARVLHREVPE